jgi:hypothetical protein
MGRQVAMAEAVVADLVAGGDEGPKLRDAGASCSDADAALQFVAPESGIADAATTATSAAPETMGFRDGRRRPGT